MPSRSAVLRPLSAAVPIGLLLAATVVWQSTSAAFTASTDNAGNTWQAGSVAIADSDSGTALFNSTNDGGLSPGSTRSRCIRVDYTGDLPADIRLYVTTPGLATLDPYLVMSVERGANVSATAPFDAGCSTGFTATATPTFLFNTAQANTPSADKTKTLSALKTAAPDYARGLPVATPLGTTVAPGTSLTFRITYSVLDDNDAQTKRSTASFTWEARSTTS